MGIYKTIFQKLTGNKKEKKVKPKKTKRMKLKKLSPEQKAKLKNIGANLKKRIISGDIQKGATVATRYAQGKPIVLKRTPTKSEQDLNPDEFIIFGIPVKKTHAYIGGALLIGGVALAVKKGK